MVQETAQSPLLARENFYISANSGVIGAFATPTIVHFCIAFLVSSTLSAPWPGLFGAAFIVAACGAVGVLYSALVLRRATRQTGYTMVMEDWTWHVVFPLASYVALLAAGLMLRPKTQPSLFAIAAATLFLVYIGIHNAWDATTFVAAQAKNPAADQATDATGGADNR